MGPDRRVVRRSRPEAVEPCASSRFTMTSLNIHSILKRDSSYIAHLKVYGCRAYPLIHEIPKKQKLQPRAQIGYLIGYNSSNIFRIWIPQEQRVIVTRDVTFDESKKYNPDDLKTPIAERPLQTIEFPDHHRDLAGGVESEDEELETLSTTDSVDSDLSSTIEVIPRDGVAPKAQQPGPRPALPTPQPTPAPPATWFLRISRS